MKRCPECGRDYNDDSLSFCLDDGAELLFGPKSSDAPQTAIFHDTDAPSEAPTRAQIHTTEPTTDVPSGTPDISKGKGFDKRLVLALLVLACIVIAGFLGYRYVSSGGTSKQIESIAVMPFVNESGNPENEYLSDGIAESLTNSFSQLPNLKVASRNSAFRYKGQQKDDQTIGRELDVRAILNGDVRQIGDQLIINVRLDDAADGRQIWGETYERKLADILAVQRDIAKEVTNNLRLKLSTADEQQLRKSYTENAEAYQLYLKGNFHAGQYTKDGLAKGIDYYNRAIIADPKYALAYNGLAYYYIVQTDWYQPAREAMPKARDAAEHALKIDENLAAAHSSLGSVAFWYDWDWVTAEKEFRRAVELEPSDAHIRQYYSWFLACMGRNNESVEEARKGLQLEPLSAEVSTFLAASLVFSRRFDEAIDQQRKALEIDATNWFAHNWLGRAYAGKGEFDLAIAEYEKADQLQEGLPEVLANLGYAYAQSGRKLETQKVLDRLRQQSTRQYVPPFNFAVIYAGLGDNDRAVEWLLRSYRDKGSSVPWIKYDPQFDGLRSDPRFRDLLARVGFPE